MLRKQMGWKYHKSDNHPIYYYKMCETTAIYLHTHTWLHILLEINGINLFGEIILQRWKTYNISYFHHIFLFVRTICLISYFLPAYLSQKDVHKILGGKKKSFSELF